MTNLRREHETGGLLLADADAKEVNLQFGFVDCDERANFEHMALQARRAVAGEVERIVLEERATRGQALRNHPQRAIEASGLPVTLGTEANTLGHQAL